MDPQPPPSPSGSPLTNPIVRGIVAAALLAALALGAFLVVRSGDGGGGGETALDGTPASEPNGQGDAAAGPLDSRPPLVGEPAPDFELRTSDGDVVRLSSLRGKVVWINFWATWCQPCKKELPDIQEREAQRDRVERILHVVRDEREHLFTRPHRLLSFSIQPGIVDGHRDSAGQFFGQRQVRG